MTMSLSLHDERRLKDALYALFKYPDGPHSFFNSLVMVEDRLSDLAETNGLVERSGTMRMSLRITPKGLAFIGLEVEAVMASLGDEGSEQSQALPTWYAPGGGGVSGANRTRKRR